jgi:hypothetical protein
VGEPGPCSSTSEYRLTLFNKGAARFAVIFRLTTMDVVGSLEVETIVHVSVHGVVQILLHVAIGPLWDPKLGVAQFPGCAQPDPLERISN